MNKNIELNDNPISIPANISKLDIMRFVGYCVSKVENGQVDPLDVYINAKAIIKAMEAITSQIEETAILQSDKFPGKTFTYRSANITKREGIDTPDTTEDEELKELKLKVKDREDLLKMAYKHRHNMTIVHPDTGEVIPIMKAKPTKSGIAITFI